MKVQTLLLCVLYLSNAAKLSGFTKLPSGARSLAMGGAYVALANTADALFSNPAGLVQIEGVEVTGFHQKPFGLEDVSYSTLSLSLPYTSFRVGLGLAFLDHDIYQETAIRLGVSGSFNGQIYYGLGLEMNGVTIRSYGSDRTFCLDFGTIIPVNKHLSLGFLTTNLSRTDPDGQNGGTPQTLTLGTAIKPRADLILSLEIFKDIRFEEEFRFGVEVSVLPAFVVRSGIASNPDRFSAGFGISRRWFGLDYAFFTHHVLGLTHQLAFTLRFGG